MKTKLAFLVLTLFFITSLKAQVKYYGGEIRVKQTGTYSVVATIELYTSASNNLEKIQLNWGDGISELVPLISTEDISGTNIRYHQLQAEHVYGQEDFYTLSINECCLVPNIANITQVDPVNFQLSTNYFHNTTDPFLIHNQMPFFEKGIITGHIYQLIQYNSNFSDLENDDILIEVCDIDYLTSYNEITEVYPVNNQLLLDSLTGSFNWFTPQLEGNYLLALCVTESRNGMIISEYTRNMLIIVEPPLSNHSVVNDDRIKVLPNPADDEINILMSEGRTINSLHAFDAQGRKVLEQGAGNRVDVSRLSSGIYVLLIQSGEVYFSKRVLID